MSSARVYDNLEVEGIETGIPSSGSSSSRMVEVTAPATLGEGYTFEARIADHVFLVTVPKGGVKEGQKFLVPFSGGQGNEENGDGLPGLPGPTGHWRDGLCDCCASGCCHPTLWNGWCCAPILLAQVMTRMKLTWLAKPGSSAEVGKTFKRIILIFISAIVVLYVLNRVASSQVQKYMIQHMDEYSNMDPSQAAVDIQKKMWTGDFGAVYQTTMCLYYGVSFVWGIFMLYLATKTRIYIRRKHDIPAQCSEKCGDCCVSYWCGCCSLTQMARHTADYNVQVGACCTSNGLSADPRIV